MLQLSARMAGQSQGPAAPSWSKHSQLEDRPNALRGQYKSVADDLMEGAGRCPHGQRATGGEALASSNRQTCPTSRNRPNRPLLIAAGALAGAVLGLLLALIVEILRRPLRSPVQLEGL